MCGVIGEWRWQHAASPLALEALAHRGPDAKGGWTSTDGHCWLGHTRLAIQDLSAAGAQPITSHCGRFTVVFNGEIYNHLQLRDQLAPISWRGHSDSETLVEALAQHGFDFLPSLRGMYAFAAYNNEHRELWLGRDPQGIKPLYVARHDDTLRFASERRALGWPTPMTQQDVAEMLTWGHLTTPNAPPLDSTRFLTSLPAASLLRVQQDQSITLHRLPWLQAPMRAKAPAVQLRSLLEQVVADHLLADVPVACFLSSGLDSGILAALACRANPSSISTFTVAFPETPIDEGSLAAAMAAHCGSEHHTLTLAPSQVIRWIEDGLQAQDVPTADGLNTYVISRAVAGEGIRVALSGLGADELFGGYPAHRLVPWLLPLRHLPTALRRSLLTLLPRRLGSKLRNVSSWQPWQLALALRRWATPADLHAAAAMDLPWPTPAGLLPADPWAVITAAELQGYTEPMLLRDSDVMSMASALEVRVPFLDQRLVDLALACSASAQRPGKKLLREACIDLFPAGYLDRPKQGFTLPMAAWMQGPLHALCLDRVKVLCRSGWLNPDWVQTQWQRFESGRLNWPRAWVLVVLGEFASRESKSSL